MCRALAECRREERGVEELTGAGEGGLREPLVLLHGDGGTVEMAAMDCHGEPLERPLGTVTHLFPSAHALAETEPRALAMPLARRGALLTLARALAREELIIDVGADRAQARRQLLALPGIGPWTAEYIAMRALRDPDAFLATDLGVRHALELLGADGAPRAAAAAAEHWRPYRAYATVHLWATLGAARTPAAGLPEAAAVRSRARARPSRARAAAA